MVWGGQVYDGSSPVVRVAGNTYQSGTFAVTRLFRVRPDYLTANLASDAATYNDIDLGSVTDGQIQEIRDQYAKDWTEWPANEGALYEDVDGDGSYNPEIDIPGIPGAAQTIFIKYDDRTSASQYGSPPIGMEVSTHYWAYAYSGALGNVIFQKVDMVYKGTETSAANSRIDSMYIVAWADADVGTSSDDFAGCDTTLIWDMHTALKLLTLPMPAWAWLHPLQVMTSCRVFLSLQETRVIVLSLILNGEKDTNTLIENQ